MFVFFFKQKTAYEMRISDWSSDVCSSDLEATGVISIGALLQELPSVGSSFNSTGSGGTSHGSSSLNLRNLGANRSLVLVNGRRWVNGAGTRGFHALDRKSVV